MTAIHALLGLEIRPGATEDGHHLASIGLNAEQLPSPATHIPPPADESAPIVLGRAEHSHFRHVIPSMWVGKGFAFWRFHAFERSSVHKSTSLVNFIRAGLEGAEP